MLADEYSADDCPTQCRAKQRSVWPIVVAAVAVVLLASCQCFGQVKITESKLAYWTFDGASVQNGQVVAPVGSKPKLDRLETTINIETAVPYKFTQVRARRLPNLERTSLEEVSPGVYRFRSGSPAGRYIIEFSAFDPERGIASEEVTVELEGAEPEPEPVLPEPTLPVLSSAARRAMQDFVARMAADMDAAAGVVESGQAKTVLELAGYTTKADVETRNVFKKSMATVLEPRLGSAALPPDAAKVLREIGAGFRSVK